MRLIPIHIYQKGDIDFGIEITVRRFPKQIYRRDEERASTSRQY